MRRKSLFPPSSMLRSVMALAIPSIVANITTPLLSMSDIAIMGHLGSADYIAAIAVGGTMFNLLYWLLGFLRMATSGLTAQASGRNDTNEQWSVIIRSLIIAFTIGILFIIISDPIGNLLIRFIDPDTATKSLATQYFDICIWGAPATLAMYVFSGWFIGMQSTKQAMWVSIFINLINIPLSIFLVYGMDMGIRGAAFGTMSAQWCGLILAVIIATTRFHPKWPGWKNIITRDKIGHLFKLNTDLFLRTLCMVAVTLWFTRVGAMQGTILLAANALLMQLFTLFSYFMDGFAFAGEALCGKYEGAGDNKGLNEAIKAVVRCGGILALIFSVIYILAGQEILSLLSNDTDVLKGTDEYFWWAVSVPIAGFTAFAWDGIVTGTSDTRLMLLSTGVASLLFFVVWWITFPHYGNHALWFAFIVYLLTRGIVLSKAFHFRHIRSKL